MFVTPEGASFSPAVATAGPQRLQVLRLYVRYMHSSYRTKMPISQHFSRKDCIFSKSLENGDVHIGMDVWTAPLLFHKPRFPLQDLMYYMLYRHSLAQIPLEASLRTCCGIVK